MSQDQILSLEFNYAAKTASEAINDRYTFLNFYIGLCTAVASVILGIAAQGNLDLSKVTAIGLSLLAFFVGVVFVVMQVMLRQKWYGSVMAMNAIKSFYISKYGKINSALIWKSQSTPSLGLTNNIHFMCTFLTIVLNSFYAGIALLIAIGSYENLYLAIVAAGVVVLVLLQILYYKLSLRD